MPYCLFECFNGDGVCLIDMTVESIIDQGRACDLIRQREGICSASFTLSEGPEVGATGVLAEVQSHIEGPLVIVEALTAWFEGKSLRLTIDLSRLDPRRSSGTLAYWTAWQGARPESSEAEVTVKLPQSTAEP